MSTIKFRPHAVVTYYNGSHEAVAVDFTPTISFDLEEFEREAGRLGATYFVVQVFGSSLTMNRQFVYKFDEDLWWYLLKNPDEVKRDIRMAVRAFELEEE